MGKIFSIGERLRQERERLGFGVEAFANLADVTRKTLYGYESGLRAPDGDALSRWANSGADVLYIITGIRSSASEQLLADIEESLNQENLPLTEEQVNASPKLSALRDKVAALLKVPGLPEEIVARAQLLLRLGFDDSEQKQLARERMAELLRRMRAFDDAYAKAAAAMEWEPPYMVVQALRSACMSEPTPSGMCMVLEQLRKGLDSGGSAANSATSPDPMTAPPPPPKGNPAKPKKGKPA